MSFETEIIYLRERIAEHGIILSSVQAEHFRIYLSELMNWNRKMNLTGLSTPKKVVTELFYDSLLVSPFLPAQGKMLDVGSGAGIPGLLIKIIRPDLETHLLEPNRKKNSFLKHTIRLLQLEKITVVMGRIENHGNQLSRDDYDLITVRALTNLETAINWSASFLKLEGLAVFFLGEEVEQPVHQATHEIKKNNLFLKKQIGYQVPESKTKRHIVIFQKGGPPLFGPS